MNFKANKAAITIETEQRGQDSFYNNANKRWKVGLFARVIERNLRAGDEQR